MTATISQQQSQSSWENFCEWITSTNNRLYVGWFGTLMIPTLLAATVCFIVAFIAAPPVDIDGIREPVAGSFPKGKHNIWVLLLETERQSAAKPQVHLRKVQRLPEGFSPLNNRLECPAPSMKGEDIVQISQLTFIRTCCINNTVCASKNA
jgi:hypothetical protein